MDVDPDTMLWRLAGPADASALARLGETSFREAWAAFNDPADMDAYCASHFDASFVRGDLARPAVRYLLAEAAGELVAYQRTESGPAPPCVKARNPIEISRVYVLQRWHGRGVGSALMQAGLDEARRAGHDVAWLAVWQRATRALAFYRRWGFEVVGTTTFRLGADLQHDFVMSRALRSHDA
jgi:GNAT superfamily N-acetyltransferase